MKFKKQKTKSVSLVTLDMAPLVDIVFNLLIFFALTLNVASGGIKLNLPTSSSSVEQEKKNITIDIDKEGLIFYDKEKTSLKDLRQYLMEYDNKNTTVVIRADNRVLYGKVVGVMDMVKSEGFSKLSIAVERKK